jgi:FAD synthase
MQKAIVARGYFDGSHMWHNGRISSRMLKKAVQQGHGEQRGEAYASVR